MLRLAVEWIEVEAMREFLAVQRVHSYVEDCIAVESEIEDSERKGKRSDYRVKRR